MIPINSRDEKNMLFPVFHLSVNKIIYTTDHEQRTNDIV